MDLKVAFKRLTGNTGFWGELVKQSCIGGLVVTFIGFLVMSYFNSQAESIKVLQDDVSKLRDRAKELEVRSQTDAAQWTLLRDHESEMRRLMVIVEVHERLLKYAVDVNLGDNAESSGDIAIGVESATKEKVSKLAPPKASVERKSDLKDSLKDALEHLQSMKDVDVEDFKNNRESFEERNRMVQRK